MDDKLKECIAYFKKGGGYTRLFKAVKEKYISLGHMGGTLQLRNLRPEEKTALQNLLVKDFSHKKNMEISIGKIEKALLNTRFEAFSLLEIVEAYFQEELITKGEEKSRTALSKQAYFDRLIDGLGWEEAKAWLRWVLETKAKPYNTLLNKYKKDKDELERLLQTVTQALAFAQNNKKMLRLAVFSTQITGNPHYFDDGSEADRIFTLGLCHLFQLKEPAKSEEKAELFFRAGIIKSDITNYTVCYGLEAFLGDGIDAKTDKSKTDESKTDESNVNHEDVAATHEDMRKHSGWLGFSEAREPLHISLANLGRISRVIPSFGNSVVFIMENPAVFSTILDALSENDHPSMLCTNGQPKLSSLLLLDKLAEEELTFYYSGDFDPEGLLIADNLKKRYGSKLQFWRFTEADYRSALSEEALTDARLSKLKKLESPQLVSLGRHIESTKYAGYQERIMERYIEDVKQTSKCSYCC